MQRDEERSHNKATIWHEVENLANVKPPQNKGGCDRQGCRGAVAQSLLRDVVATVGSCMNPGPAA